MKLAVLCLRVSTLDQTTANQERSGMGCEQDCARRTTVWGHVGPEAARGAHRQHRRPQSSHVIAASRN